MAIPSGVTFEVVHEQQDLSDFRFLILAAFDSDLYDPGLCF